MSNGMGMAVQQCSFNVEQVVCPSELYASSEYKPHALFSGSSGQDIDKAPGNTWLINQ
jgi:hypothetical protein